MKNRFFSSAENLMKLFIFLFNFVVIIEPLSKCWKCASNSNNTAFCGDPFDESKLNDTQRLANLPYCTAPPNRPSTPDHAQQNQIFACRKIKKIGLYFHIHLLNEIASTHLKSIADQFFVPFLEKGIVVVERSCLWVEIDNPIACEKSIFIPQGVTLEACELCYDKDGCNHSSRMATQFGQIAALMAIPLASARIFSF